MVIFLSDAKNGLVANTFVGRHIVERMKGRVIGVPLLSNADFGAGWRKFTLVIKRSIACAEASLRMKNNDLVVVWLDSMGVILYVFSRILRKSPKILVLNLMIPSATGFLGKLRLRIYRILLAANNVAATVNNEELIFTYQQRLNLQLEGKVSVLTDSLPGFAHLAATNHHKKSDRSRVFFGGASGRDFSLARNIAEEMSDLDFIFIVRSGAVFGKGKLPENVELLENVSEDFFYECMATCDIVIIPIESDSPAGILTILMSGAARKPVLCTSTPSTRPYLRHEDTGMLIETNRSADWMLLIRNLINDSQQAKTMGTRLYEEVRTLYSEEAYLENLDLIIAKQGGAIENFTN